VQQLPLCSNLIEIKKISFLLITVVFLLPVEGLATKKPMTKKDRRIICLSKHLNQMVLPWVKDTTWWRWI
jgi:hypothetical protein